MLKNHRLALLLATFLIFTTGCDTLNSVRMMQINSNIEPVVTKSQPIALNARFIGEKPYIYATVDDEELLFLLDTGARFLLLFDTPKVKGLKLKQGFKLALSGWGDEEGTQAFQTKIAQMDMGGVKFEGLNAAYIPISTSPYFLREDEAFVDGVIGHDMLKHFVWHFDKSSNLISVSQKPYQASKNAEPFELDIFFSKIRIEGEVAFNDKDSASSQFIIDTGSRHYLKISSQYPTNRNIDIDSTSVTSADFGLNGKVEHRRVSLPHLKLGRLEIPNIKTNLIPSKDDDEDDFWVIGNALLNQYSMIIDYPSEMMYLEPQGAFNVRYNLLGLELRKIRSGEFVVRYVSPNLPASEFDIKVGDLVTSIADKSSKELSMEDFLTISAEPGLKRLCIERQSQCFEIFGRHIKGYSMQ